MTKEKFEHLKFHINIENIKNVDCNKNNAEDLVKSLCENYERYTQLILQDLINKYGEEEGKIRFEKLKQETNERYGVYKTLDSTPEKRKIK